MSDTAEVKTLIIDEQEVSAGRGQTILEVALENGIKIPTLCHLEGLSNVGACRLCLVEVKGSNKLLPACITRSTKAWRSPPSPSASRSIAA
jgi:bidirectional [NiFe] hydrogenase diaphorase subunit